MWISCTISLLEETFFEAITNSYRCFIPESYSSCWAFLSHTFLVFGQDRIKTELCDFAKEIKETLTTKLEGLQDTPQKTKKKLVEIVKTFDGDVKALCPATEAAAESWGPTKKIPRVESREQLRDGAICPGDRHYHIPGDGMVWMLWPFFISSRRSFFFTRCSDM